MSSAQLLQLKRAASDKPAVRNVQGRGMVAAAQALARRGLVKITPLAHGYGIRTDVTDAGLKALADAE